MRTKLPLKLASALRHFIVAAPSLSRFYLVLRSLPKTPGRSRGCESIARNKNPIEVSCKVLQSNYTTAAGSTRKKNSHCVQFLVCVPLSFASDGKVSLSRWKSQNFLFMWKIRLEDFKENCICRTSSA